MAAQRTTAGAFGAPTGMQQPAEARREPAGAGTYSAGQTGQRWPENVGGREQQPSDVKESASRMGEQAQERAQSAARGAGQPGRNAAEEAAERARQSGNRDYRSGR
jgi:hypothetical protein